MAKFSFDTFLKQTKNQSGFSLLEIMVAALISSLVVFGTTSIFIDSKKIESRQERQFWLSARRLELQGLIRSQDGWLSILNENPNMACFAAGTSCAAFTTPQPLQIKVDGATLDGSKATVGMNSKGDFCNSFDGAIGNSRCPVGIKLQWSALCDDANCFHAQPKIEIEFQSKEPDRPLEPLPSFDLVAFKDPKLESLNQVCTAMGGVLVGITCSITSLSSACDPANNLGGGATFPLGFDSTGSVICGQPNPGTCAASDVATGFNANGGIICAPACN